MENVEKEPNNIITKISLLLLAAISNDLGLSSNMAAKKQNTIQDSKKSA